MKKQSKQEKIVTLLMTALEGEKLSEKAWKRIARLNEIILRNLLT